MSTETSPSSVSESARLRRLQVYLQGDPHNEYLLADAFDAALDCGQLAMAEQYAVQADLIKPGDPFWTLRRAHLYIASSDFELARQALGALAHTAEAVPALQDTVLHDLSFIDLLQNETEACLTRLEPRLSTACDGLESAFAVPASLVCLWLRALHRQGELQQALGWLRDWPLAEAAWPAEVAGVASLVALDAEQLDDAKRWSEQALRPFEQGAEPRSVEAWLTQACLALLNNNTAHASRCAEHALALRPDDGRVISTSAFVALQTGQLEPARQGFVRAVALLPRHIGTWHGLGWVQVLQLDLPGAQSSFESALSLDPNFADSHGALGVVAALQKTPAKAQSHLRRAMRLNPASLPAQIGNAILGGDITDVAGLQQHVQRWALAGGRGRY